MAKIIISNDTAGVMTAKQVCEVLGISLPTLSRRVAAGEIIPLPKAPGQKRRHRLLFDRSQVESFLKETA